MSKINRREALGQMAWGAVGASVATSALASEAEMAIDESIKKFDVGYRDPASDVDWADVRKNFNLDLSYRHFGGFLIASHPKPVRDEIERIRTAFDRNPVYGLRESSKRSSVTSAAGEYMGVSSGNVSLTDSTTMSMSLLYTGIKLSSDQEIIASNHSHPWATRTALDHLKARTGANTRIFNIYGNNPHDISPQTMVDNVKKAIRSNTRVLCLTWVHSDTGMKIPAKMITDAVRQINQNRSDRDKVLIAMDGVHGFGIDGETIPELGVDFFGAGTHKWIFGPRGTGVLAFKDSAAARMVLPTIPSFSGNRNTPGGFHSFEHRWALDKAFKFHLNLGKKNVGARIHFLNRKVKEGLKAMSKVTLLTPMADELSAGIICFNVRGQSPSNVISALSRQKVIGSVSPYSLRSARLAPSLYTMEADVDKALNVIDGM